MAYRIEIEFYEISIFWPKINISGNDGAEMVECLEKQTGAKIKVQQDEVVLVDTDDMTKKECIETELTNAWHQDDFERQEFLIASSALYGFLQFQSFV